MGLGINPFKAGFFHIAKKLKLDLEAASFVEHSGLKGARIESVLAEFLRDVLPTRYHVSINQIVIDCEAPHLNGSTVKIRKRRIRNGKQATEA